MKRIIPVSIGIASSLFVIMLSFIFQGLFYDWEAKTLDYRFALRGRIDIDPNIIMVDCDDRSVSKIGRWPWDRTWHAQMIDILSESEAGVIAYDILFNQPVDKKEDEALILATQKGNKVYYPVGFELTAEGGSKDSDIESLKGFGYRNQPIERGRLLSVSRSIAPFPTLSNASKGLGHISSNRDRDGIIRRVPLLVDLDGTPFPAFGLHVVAGYQSVTQDDISIYPGREIILKGKHDIRIPINQQGMMLINYAGRWVDTFEHYSFIDLIERAKTKDGMGELRERFKGKLVIISNSATGFDMKSMPLEVDYPGGGIHANIINTMLTENFLIEISPLAKITVLLLLSILVVIVSFKKEWDKRLIFISLLSVGYLLFVYLAFRYLGLVLDLFSPFFVIFSSTLNLSLYELSSEKRTVAQLRVEKKILADEINMTKGMLGQKEMELSLINQELGSLKMEMNETSSKMMDQISRVEELEGRLERELKEKERLLIIKRGLDDKVAVLFVDSTKKDYSLKGRWEELRSECSRYGIVTRSEKLLKLFEEIKKAAKTDSPILILGESGVGKGLFAKAIHLMSARSNNPFITVDLPVIADSLIESELFGHLKGAFTGAISNKTGRFELASGGTIFLDEIGDMGFSMQVKLRRVLQDKVIERVGDTKTIRVDIRIISATNKDLRQEIREGRFREDLFHRLNVMSIELPPLRERKEDIELLVNYFIDRYRIEYKKNIKGISKTALNLLIENEWNGNIRELENIISRATIMAEGDMIREDDLGLDRKRGDRPIAITNGPIDVSGDLSFLKLLRDTNFEIGKAADLLNISRGTVSSRFKGVCLQCLQKYNGDIRSTAREIAGNDNLASLVEERIREYNDNIISIISSFEDPQDAISECRKRLKNIPGRYMSAIEWVVRNYFDCHKK